MADLTLARRDGRPSPRRRAAALVIALAIELLWLLAFLGLDFTPDRKTEIKGGTLVTFDVSGNRPATKVAAAKPAPAAPTTTTAPRPVPPPPRIVLPPRPLDLLVVTKQVYAAADIAKLGQAAPADSGSGSEAGGSAPGDSARLGTGPNGEALYAAEWVREPTHQELRAYLPERMPDSGGWGLVACRTIADFRVDDCVELGSAPLGSRLARSVRQAAWQFRVRPPRVGGKPLVGEWVQIRIDYRVSG